MRRYSSFIPLAFAAIVLAGCSQDAEPTSQTVRLLTHDSFVVSEDLITQLREDTGITLEVISGGDAGSIVAGAVLASGQPTADVLFGIDNTLLARAIDADVFEAYVSPERDQIIPELLANTDVVTPIDYGDVCINIDDRWFGDQDIATPTTLDDLIDPMYKGLLVVQDPASSSPGLAFLLATIARYGDNWPQYWAALADNDVLISGSWSDAYFSLFTQAGGDRPLVVSYATSPPAEIVYAEDPKPTTVSTSVMVDGCYRQIEYAGILRGSSNTAAAGQVIDWLLSEQVQEDVPLSMFVFPARQGVPLPQVFTDFAAEVPNPLQLEPDVVAENLSSWLTEWGTVMGR
jgi:thiamine transport system substrate-binding protein